MIDFKSLHEQYVKAEPYPHIVLDNVFNPAFLELVANSIPLPDSTWWEYDNIFERKYAKNKIDDQIPLSIKTMIYSLLMGNQFVTDLEKLTGIEGLITDHTLNGGGIHQIVQGGKLDIHADYNYHPITKLDRRINVLVYLNQNWKSEWGGNLELWDQSMTQCVKSIEPLFNRVVIFSTTDHAYHGHPIPLNCPKDISRKSIAIYYYTNGRPENEKSEPHSTLFQKRPEDQISEETEKLRMKRSQTRLTL